MLANERIDLKESQHFITQSLKTLLIKDLKLTAREILIVKISDDKTFWTELEILEDLLVSFEILF